MLTAPLEREDNQLMIGWCGGFFDWGMMAKGRVGGNHDELNYF